MERGRAGLRALREAVGNGRRVQRALEGLGGRWREAEDRQGASRTVMIPDTASLLKPRPRSPATCSRSTYSTWAIAPLLRRHLRLTNYPGGASLLSRCGAAAILSHSYK